MDGLHLKYPVAARLEASTPAHSPNQRAVLRQLGWLRSIAPTVTSSRGAGLDRQSFHDSDPIVWWPPARGRDRAGGCEEIRTECRSRRGRRGHTSLRRGRRRSRDRTTSATLIRRG